MLVLLFCVRGSARVHRLSRRLTKHTSATPGSGPMPLCSTRIGLTHARKTQFKPHAAQGFGPCFCVYAAPLAKRTEDIQKK